MGLAKTINDSNGIPKKEFETSLLYLNNQIRIIEQKLSLKVDHKIETEFSKCQHKINVSKETFNRI
ncbi:hypothetical protein SAMN05216389_102219 [Oceanobacillus limi]|uniref:Uncharacterized protein n=1 Tax=Oceanobacillus limi TaxID=930131 RepID=A0A1H9ZFM6_9BACI|nr:hypothetical protein [Oceanobacillus limi]SES79860.1 hypothetical protein SAMN05216389_102219 [Oceanobacillus limi]